MTKSKMKSKIVPLTVCEEQFEKGRAGAVKSESASRQAGRTKAACSRFSFRFEEVILV
jgi:hypothetical protein